MNNTEARQIFDNAITEVRQYSQDPKRIARMELMREYFCNPDFREAMADEVFRIKSAR